MTTTTEATTMWHPTWCERQDHDPDACDREGRHSDRVWRFDASGYLVELSVISYIETVRGRDEHGPATMLLRVSNTEMVETVTQNTTPAEVEALVAMLTAALPDARRALEWDTRERETLGLE